MSGPLVQAIGWALLHMLWQGVLVAAILAAALALLQRQSANARYLASCGALLLLVVLGAATGYRAYDPIRASSPVLPSVSLVPFVPDHAPQFVLDAPAAAATWRDEIDVLLSFVRSHLSEIVAIWLAGVFILSSRLVIGWIGAHRLRARRARPASDQIQNALMRIATALRLQRSVRLLESEAVEVPTVVGWLKPVVLLPIASLSGLSMQQVEMILAHELAHIRRHDFIVNLLQSIIETLLFYHPAVWWISRRIRVEREHCCDDLAVAVFGDPVQYARALTRFEELRLDNPRSAIAVNGGSLIDRIRRLVAAHAESSHWPSRWAAGAALLAVLAVIVIAPAFPLFANLDPQTPPATAAPPARAKAKKDPAKCDQPEAPHAKVEVEATADDSADSDEEQMDSEAPEVNPAEVALAVAEGVKGGVKGGIKGGVEGGIKGGVATAIHVALAPFAVAVPNVEVMPMVAATPAPTPPPTPRVRQRLRRKIGEGGKFSVEDLITLRGAGVNPQYIDEMRGAGLGELTLDDIVSLRVTGVTPAAINALRAAGVEVNSAETAIGLRAQNITPEYVKQIAEAGYTHLSAEELIRLKATGVDAEFIRQLAKYRTK